MAREKECRGRTYRCARQANIVESIPPLKRIAILAGFKPSLLSSAPSATPVLPCMSANDLELRRGENSRNRRVSSLRNSTNPHTHALFQMHDEFVYGGGDILWRGCEDILGWWKVGILRWEGGVYSCGCGLYVCGERLVNVWGCC